MLLCSFSSSSCNLWIAFSALFYGGKRRFIFLTSCVNVFVVSFLCPPEENAPFFHLSWPINSPSWWALPRFSFLRRRGEAEQQVEADGSGACSDGDGAHLGECEGAGTIKECSANLGGGGGSSPSANSPRPAVNDKTAENANDEFLDVR